MSDRDSSENEHVFRNFFENSVIGMSMTSLDGKLKINKAFGEILGYDPDELAGVNWTALTHPDDLAQNQLEFESILSGKKSSARWKKRYFHKKGEIVWVDISTALQRDTELNPQFFITTITDITPQVDLRDSFAHSEFLLRESQEIAQLGTYDFDLISGFWTSSEILDRIFGISKDYCRSFEGWSEIMHPDWQQIMVDYVNLEVVGNRKGFDREYKIVRINNGEERWVHGRGKLLYGADGNPVRLIGTILDITGLKQVEEKLYFIEKAVEATSDAIGISDAGGHHFYQNRALTDLFGYASAEELESAGGGSSVVKDPEVARGMFANIMAGESWTGELEMVTRSGRVFPAFERADAIKDQEGNVIGLIGIISDITERKQKESAWLAKQQRISRQRNAIATLAVDHAIAFGNCPMAMDAITELVSGTIGVDRVSIWQLSENQQELICVSLFESGPKRHSKGPVLNSSDYPRYFKALATGSLISTMDAQTDDRTSDFTEGYLVPLGITSMLDVGFMLEGELAGVVCLEHTGDPREWKSDEEGFVSIVASLVSQTYSNEKRRISEEALRESEERYRLLVETLPDSVIVHSAGRIVFANKASAKVIGAAGVDEVIGMPVIELVHPDYREMAVQRFQKSLTEGVPLPMAEEKLVRLNGTVIDVDVTAVPISFGGQPAMLTVTNDITERKRAARLVQEKTEVIQAQNEQYLQLNEELTQTNEALLISKDKAEESDRLKSAFLANMSHEIRTPLNSIIGFSELLSEEENNQEEVFRFSSVIHSSGNRLLELINHLIDISKIESGTEPIRYSMVAPALLIREVAVQFRLIAGEKSIEILGCIPSEMEDLQVKTDSLKLHQVLTNLVGNSMKYTTQGSVEIGLNRHPKGILFYVRDTGIGIPADKIIKVFDRFYQVESPHARHTQGAGLGLSLCKSMVELLGGKIWVESQLGQGSKFSFVIPENPGTQ